MASNRWERLKHRRWQRNVGVLSIQRICVVTLLRVIGLQAAFENQFDTAIHPATVTGMVGVPKKHRSPGEKERAQELKWVSHRKIPYGTVVLAPCFPVA